MLPEPGLRPSPQATSHPALPGASPQSRSQPATAAATSLDPFRWQRQHISLPEITLSGPVELVFPAPTQLALFLPHSVEAPSARRLLLAPGAALTLRNIRGVSLRRPVELPNVSNGFYRVCLGGKAGASSLGRSRGRFRAGLGAVVGGHELFKTGGCWWCRLCC